MTYTAPVYADEETMLRNLLLDNWTTAFPKPYIYFDDSYKTGDVRLGIIKIYYLHSSPIKPRGIGFNYKEVTHTLIIDVRASQRVQALRIREEVVRILDLKRVCPTADYSFLTYTEGSKINNYAGNYRWILNVYFKQLRQPIGAIT